LATFIAVCSWSFGGQPVVSYTFVRKSRDKVRDHTSDQGRSKRGTEMCVESNWVCSERAQFQQSSWLDQRQQRLGLCDIVTHLS